jgi:hypothetical protein
MCTNSDLTNCPCEKKLCDSFLNYWYNLKKCINEDKKGKLCTNFTFKEHLLEKNIHFLMISKQDGQFVKSELVLKWASPSVQNN